MTASDCDRAALAASEELNRRILEAVPGGIVHVGIDGSILLANREALRILGLTFDEITRKYTTEFETETIHEDGAPFSANEYPVSLVLTTGRPSGPATLGVRRPDGQLSWAVFAAVPVYAADEVTLSGAVVTFLDITARRQAEDALRESQALLSSVVDSVAGFVATVDLDARLLFLNRPAPGLSLADALGRQIWDFVSDTERERSEFAFRTALATGEPQVYEARTSSAFGGGLFRTTVVPRRQGGKVVGATYHAVDVTEQRDMEARLMLSDRLAAIGTLAASVAHEVNNPLTFIMAHLDWIGREVGTRNPGVARRVYEAIEGTERIRDVVRDLTSFARREEGLPLPVKLSTVLDRALRIAQNELRYRARVTCDYGDMPDVGGHPGRLGQVFLNVLLNAAHAIPAGQADNHEIRITMRLSREGVVRTSVHDTGEGMSPAVLDGIFDPFVTTKGPGEGTGLGLYISHNIVKGLGGQISVESEPGKGSTFHIDLPVYVKAGSTRPPQAMPPSPSIPANLRVLVVDDEPNIRALLAQVLAPHEVVCASSGKEATDTLAQRSFDVIVCDLIMPHLTGMDVHDYVLANKPEMSKRFVFITGAAFTDRAEAFVSKVNPPTLQKPFGLNELREAFARIL